MASPNWDDLVPFEKCCAFFEKMVSEKDKKKRVIKLEKFLRHCRNECQAQGGQDSSLYPIVRLMLPMLDRERSAYGIKETLLAKLYIDMLKIGQTSSDAMRLKNYRSGANNNQSEAGDFASVLFAVIKDRQSGQHGNISVGELNRGLDDLAVVSAKEGRDGVERILFSFFKKMSSVEQKWMVRIILKDMKIGMGQNSIWKAFHPDAQEFYNSNSNLRKVCETLKDPEIRQNEIAINLFSAFKPMLADRCSVKNILKFMNGNEFYIEVKYDGERMLLHKNGPDFKFFSRNSFDFTDDFGHNAGDVDKFSHYLSKCLNPSAKTIILDGEICAYNHQTETLTQKGEQMNIRTLGSNHSMFQQCLYVYDIVYLNGEVLSNKPLSERIKILSSVVTERKGRVQFADRKIGRCKKEVIDSLNDAIDRREEGIVVKDPQSVYKPSARSRGGWYKLKPEYTNSLMDQCDLLIMGGYYGTGKRGGMVTHFLLGLLNKNEVQGMTEIHSFCRVGSGYSMIELFDLLKKLQTHFRSNSKQSTAVTIDEYKMDFGREKPDVILDPRKSVVLQVKAAEIVSSDVYKTRCTLRFPRVEKVRHDKTWEQCMTVQEMQDLRKQSDGKLTSRHMNEKDDNESGGDFSTSDKEEGSTTKTKRRRKGNNISAKRFKSSVGMSQMYKATAALDNVMVETHSLKDMIIVIEPCDAELKKELEEVVRMHGGQCEQNVRPGFTHCYVETGLKLRAKSVIRSGQVDVVRSAWLKDCKVKFRRLRPSDMIFTTNATEAKFEECFDEFGDGFMEETTLESLKHSLNMVSKLGKCVKINPTLMAEFEEEYFCPPYKMGMFRECVVHIPDLASFSSSRVVCESGESHLEYAALKLQFYGARIVNEITDSVENVSHVVVIEKYAPNLLQELKQVRRKRKKKFFIVSTSWVEASINGEMMANEGPFEL